MTPRRARQEDLAEIVAIYNSTVASGQSTADLQPVRIEQRQAWFDAHRQPNRPLYVWRDDQQNMAAWASFSDYYPQCRSRSTDLQVLSTYSVLYYVQ